MTKTEFIREMMEKIPEYIPESAREGLNLSLQQVVKVNDQVLNGVVFRTNDEAAAPTIYLDDAYKDAERGMPTDMIAQNIASAYMDSKDLAPMQSEASPESLNYDKIRDQITMRLVEMKRNRQFLQDRPYMNVGHGLALTCDIQISGRGGAGIVSITNDLMKQSGYDKRQLFENAMADAWHNAPPTLRDMQASLTGIGDDNLLDAAEPVRDSDKAMMYVLTNGDGQYGAAAMFYPGMQERIAENLGESYYALPSSLHEYLIVPESAGIDPEQLASMVRDANRTESVIQPKDVLSDQVLHYDREAKFLENLPLQKEMDTRMEAR